MRLIIVIAIILCSFVTTKAQDRGAKKQTDTLKDFVDTTGYVNQGKIAGRKAAMKSLIFPGLGQIYNYGLVVDDVKNNRVEGKRVAQKLYIIGKTAGIYVGGTILVLSYIDNREQYKRFLTELQYRQQNSDRPDPNGGLAQYTNTSALTIAKNIYKRNSQIVLISLGAVYGLNVLDAYVTARLKYFNIDETLSLKVAPSIINNNTMYGFSAPAAPALKLTLKL
jgi:Family of unknown function (DUF5683)